MATSVADLVLAAQDFIQRAIQPTAKTPGAIELDLSVESMAFVDHYLRTVGEVSDAVLDLIAPAIGAYFGEVAIAHLGGSWRTVGEPSGWTVVLKPAPITFSPAGMAAEAIRTGPVEGYDGSLLVPPEFEAALDDALAASGPVEESYYYSLTGRLETMEHAVEVFVELRRRRLEEGER